MRPPSPRATACRPRDIEHPAIGVEARRDGPEHEPAFFGRGLVLAAVESAWSTPGLFEEARREEEVDWPALALHEIHFAVGPITITFTTSLRAMCSVPGRAARKRHTASDRSRAVVTGVLPAGGSPRTDVRDRARTPRRACAQTIATTYPTRRAIVAPKILQRALRVDVDGEAQIARSPRLGRRGARRRRQRGAVVRRQPDLPARPPAQPRRAAPRPGRAPSPPAAAGARPRRPPRPARGPGLRPRRARRAAARSCARTAGSRSRGASASSSRDEALVVVRARRRRSRGGRARRSGRSPAPGRSPRPARPATCSSSWKVRSAARKSGRCIAWSGCSTPTSVTPGKSCPLVTICVPTSMSISPRVHARAGCASRSRARARCRRCRDRAGPRARRGSARAPSPPRARSRCPAARAAPTLHDGQRTGHRRACGRSSGSSRRARPRW